MLPFESHGAKGSAGIRMMDSLQERCPGALTMWDNSGVPYQGRARETPPARQAAFGASSCCPGWADRDFTFGHAPGWLSLQERSFHCSAPASPPSSLALLLLSALPVLRACAGDALRISSAESAWPGVSGWV